MSKYKIIFFGVIKTIAFILFFQITFGAIAFDGPIKIRRACLNPTDRSITLYFNGLTDPCGTFTKIEVEGRIDKTNPGAFQTVHTTGVIPSGTISFTQPDLNVWEYYIKYFFMCDGVTILHSDTISIDLTPPTFLELDSVSVDLTSQKVIIGWPKNPSIDHMGYLVFESLNSNNVQITDQTSESYIHLPSNPSFKSETYTYNSYDSCSNFNILAKHHSTIHLTSSPSLCANIINLNWTAYFGWVTEKYYVYVSTNSGPYLLVDSTSSLNYTYNNAINGANYSFYVQSKKQFSTFTSSSNTSSLNFPNPISASNTYIKSISVLGSNLMEIKWNTNNPLRTRNAQLYRAKDNEPLLFIKNIPFQNGANIATDIVNTETGPYTYRIILQDSCPLQSDSSETSRSVFLSRDQAELKWNSYVFESNTNNGDHIFVSSSTWNQLGITFQGGTATWIIPEDSALCYRIISISNANDSSISNIICIEDDLRVYIPSAIKLNGSSTNNIFTVTGTGIDWEKSTVGIFTRWGEKIYQLQNQQQIWDATYKQKKVPSGIYMYSGLIIGVKGDKIPVRGTILILD